MSRERGGVDQRGSLPNASRGRRSATDPSSQPLKGTGRTSRGRDTRERLITSARTVFERDGFLHARLADICAEAGISLASFYTYFRSKEEIFDEVTSSVELDLLDMPVRGDELDPVERIREANRHFLQFFKANAAILAVIDQVATFDETVAEDRRLRHERFAHAIERRILAHQEEGITDSRIDAGLAANALGAMVNGMARDLFITNAATSGGSVDMDEVAEQLTLLWATAIGLEVPES